MSQIKIYKTEVLPAKNALIDDLADYLNSLTVNYESECQYIKVDLELNLKIVANQEKVTKAVGNYLDLYQDEKHYYFFITGAKWTSKEAVNLSLMLDTINTFRDELEFTEKTTINRQHKDRYKTLNKWDLVADTVTTDSYKNLTNYNVDLSSYFEFPLDQGNFPIEFTASDVTILNKYHQVSKHIGTVTKIDWEDFTNEKYNLWFYNGNQVVLKINQDEYKEWFKNNLLMIQATVYDDDVETHTIYQTYCSHINGYWLAFSYRYKIIDLLSEGITPIKYHNQDKDIEIQEAVNDSYYLIYKNATKLNETTQEEEIDDAVDCYITSNKRHQLTKPAASVTSPFDITKDDSYTPKGSTGAFLISKENVGTVLYWQLSGGTKKKIYEFNNSNNVIAVLYTTYSDTGVARNSCSLYYYDENWNYKSKQDLLSGAFETRYFYLDNSKVMRKGKYADGTTRITSAATIETYPIDINYSSGYTQYLENIDTLDRTQQSLIKVIKLPYAPIGFKIVDDILVYDKNNWVYSPTTGFLKLLDLGTRFENTIEFTENPLNNLVDNAGTVSLTELRNDKYEPKLFHSDYYTPKFVYDSFNLGFALEQVDLDKFVAGKLKLKFNPTSTINSRFLFTFPQYVLKYSSSDFDNIIYVNRNNEETLYNSAYINYVRTGYNYDKKKAEQSNAMSWIGTAASLVGSAMSIYGAVGSFNANKAIPDPNNKGVTLKSLWGSNYDVKLPALDMQGNVINFAAQALLSTTMWGRIASAVTTSVTSIAGSLMNQIQNEQSINQKLDELRNQAVQVSGADDVDLLDVYCNNKMKICYYQVSDQIKEKLGDLFYYTGYVENKQGIPDLDTRSWFNYIMCDADFAESDLYESFVGDAKGRYATGVTVYHNHMIDNVKTWDFDQKYENWENSLLN